MNPFTAPDPEQSRSFRELAALRRISERHQAPPAANPWLAELGLGLEPTEAVERVVRGASDPAAAVDADDVMAALTLVPRVRTSVDELEMGLLQMARGRGLTWQQIAFGLGLGTPQAARQRYERLVGRTDQQH
ncbi:DNA-binding protein [Longispora sp. K20-0274]|uniref:DNA-binding protein n=1 Tax=Longispora sp. K20-0274 TaxID=3088255 RepID=UPI00399B73CF